MQNDSPHVDICGLRVLRRGAPEIAEQIVSDIKCGTGNWVLTLNLEMLAQMRLDKTYAQKMQSVDFAVADGMPIVWASCLMGAAIKGRSTGITLSRLLLASSDITRVALIGGKNPKLISELFLKREYMIWDMAIEYTDATAQKLVSELREEQIQLVLIALGVPKQDAFACYIRKHLPTVTIIGIGGALDAISGLRKTAPAIMSDHGFEWLFRLWNEPRLWRRYLLKYPFGVIALLCAVLAGELQGRKP